MPISQLLNTKIDHVENPKIRLKLRDEVLRFIESDLICYFEENDEVLIARQKAYWTPLLDWFKAEHGVCFVTSKGINFVEQDPQTFKSARQMLDGLSSYEFTVFQSAVGIVGSYVIALALTKKHIDSKTAFDAAVIDEVYQSENWGEDAEAIKNRENVYADLMMLEDFLETAS